MPPSSTPGVPGRRIRYLQSISVCHLPNLSFSKMRDKVRIESMDPLQDPVKYPFQDPVKYPF
jgi:hypothetical protein